MNIDELFEIRKIEDEEELVYIGTFGEDLRFKYVDTNKWIFWSIVLKISELVVDDEGKKSLLTDYCFFNNKDFDLKKIYEFRIYNTNELTTKFYNKYIETKDSLFLDLLSKEMVHISYYKLSKRNFRWYIIEEPHNSELVSKEKKGLFYKLRKDANKWIKKNKKQ